MTKSEKLQIFRLIQDRELGLYHQCPWLFQERVEKSLIKYDRYEFIKFQSYSGPIVIDDQSIYSNRMTKCETLTNLNQNNMDRLQEIYSSSTYPFKRLFDYMLITSMLWSFDKVPLPAKDYLDGFYCLALKTNSNNEQQQQQQQSTHLYIQSHRTGRIVEQYPLSMDSLNYYQFRHLEYDANCQQLIIHSKRNYWNWNDSNIGIFSMIIFKLFPFRLRTFVEFDKAIERKTISMVSVQNDLLIYGSSGSTWNCLFIYHLDSILKLNAIDQSITVDHQQFLQPNCHVKKLTECLFKFDCNTIEFISPIPWLFLCHQKQYGFYNFSSNFYIHDLKCGQNQQFNDNHCHNSELFQHQLYFNGIKRSIYYITSDYLAIYRHYPPKSSHNDHNSIRLIQTLNVNELRGMIDDRSLSVTIIQCDYLDQLDTMLLLTINLEYSHSLQLHIVDNLHQWSASRFNHSLKHSIRTIKLREMRYFEDYHYQIYWQYNFIIIGQRNQSQQYLYIYQLQF
ncbi:uncharacterized protein LOC113796834 [Dermatophagoides pteronyssinus]|uniref:Uncharacterized protein LOC113796834 n=1 Tax=Dermatophagoides pteronyssinus TaxID=6956 RepID=A0A6P6YBW6_DERPT|nr:uncharacterized protein LOC113796834 [Dermatophagoides pteronyssinus]